MAEAWEPSFTLRKPGGGLALFALLLLGQSVGPVVPATAPDVSPGPMAAGELVLNSQEQQVSYGLGYDMGKRLVDLAPDGGLDVSLVARGLMDSQAPTPTFAPDQMAALEALTNGFIRAAQQRARQGRESLGQKSVTAILEQNKQIPGVVQTQSGLQYRVLRDGLGRAPGPGDWVRVRYVAQLTDGTVFDSSERHGGAVSLPLSSAIPGWAEGTQVIKEGGAIELWLPPDLAYGPQGAPGLGVPAFSVLYYRVELLQVP